MAALLLSGAVQAQLSLKRQKYDSIAARNKGEHAVYTDIIRKMVIKEVDGDLTTSSHTILEKLFISEKSLNTKNSDPVHGNNYTYMRDVSEADPDVSGDLDAEYYVPEKNDYKVVKSLDRYGRPTTQYSGLTKKSITHTSYVQHHYALHLLPQFFFSDDIPVLNSVFEISAPKYVKMGFLLKGEDTSMIKRTVVEKNGVVTYRFTGTNVPANKNYKGVPSPKYYYAHVIPYVISFRLTGAKKDSVLTGTIEDFNKFAYRHVSGLNLKDDTFLNRKTAELTRYAYSDRDKVQRIYDWVQKYFHYISMPANDAEGFTPREADSVCKRMYGDCKDMSSVFYAMCRKAGIPAYFTHIGSDNQPYTHDEIQSQRLYDHMIAAVKLDGEWLFLDGTTHVMPMGANREDLQGKEACIMMDNKRCEVVKIPEAPSALTQVSSSTTMNISYGGDVSGTISRHYTGYEAWGMAETLNYMNRKDEKDKYIREKMRSGNDKFLIPNYNINRNEQGQKDISINANYTLGNYAVPVKKDYYVNMNVNESFTDMRVNDEDRKTPYYLPYKNRLSETVTLNVPKGYRVASLPKPAKGGADGLWSYTITYKADKKSNTVILTKEYELKTMKISPSQFEAHNKQIDDLKKQYKETVVLTK